MTLRPPDGGRTGAQRDSAVLGLLAGRWVRSVLIQVASDSQRHRDLVGAIDDISEKVLTDTLRHMERDGLLTRGVGTGVPSHVEYHTTALANSLASRFRRYSSGKCLIGTRL
jgi:DNA-binding HxlR family transcriptional regulator